MTGPRNTSPGGSGGDVRSASSGPDPRVRPDASAPVCERCGQTMLDRHCKVVCLNCGYQRDCSDP